VRDSAASLPRCPPESSLSLPPHAQSAPAWRSKPVQKWSDVPRASSACIPTAPRVAPDQPTARLRCRRTPLLACPPDPVPKRLTGCPCGLDEMSGKAMRPYGLGEVEGATPQIQEALRKPFPDRDQQKGGSRRARSARTLGGDFGTPPRPNHGSMAGASFRRGATCEERSKHLYPDGLTSNPVPVVQQLDADGSSFGPPPSTVAPARAS